MRGLNYPANERTCRFYSNKFCEDYGDKLAWQAIMRCIEEMHDVLYSCLMKTARPKKTQRSR